MLTDHPEFGESELGSELDFDVTEAMMGGPVDMTALLIRRFAWDVSDCQEVPGLLTTLGLTHGSPEGMDLDHRESHHRMAPVLPMEGQLRAYSSVVGAVITKSLLSGEDGEVCNDHEQIFAQQNTEVILAGSRAIIGQLMFTGVLAMGPAAGTFSVAVVDGE